VGGVDWPLCVPPTVERDRRAWSCFTFHKHTLGLRSVNNTVQSRDGVLEDTSRTKNRGLGLGLGLDAL